MAKDYSHLGFIPDKKEDEEIEIPTSDSSDGLLETSLETLGATAAGVGQGFTFGTGTKALAALEALGELQDQKESSLASLYKRYKELEAKNTGAYEELAKKHPMATFSGEIGGSILNPIPGTAAKVGAEALGAAKLAKALDIAPSLVTRSGAGALLGAGTTAINSKGEGLDYLEDIAKGTITGGALGVGEDYVARGVKSAGKYLENSPKLQRIIRAFQLERGTPTEMNPEGKPINLGGETTRKGGGPTPIFEQLNYVKNKLTDSFKNMSQLARDEFDEFFKTEGKTLLDPKDKNVNNIINFINEHKDILSKHLGSDIVEKLTSGIPTLDSTGMRIAGKYTGTVSDLYNLRSALYDNINKLSDTDLLHRDIQNALFGTKGAQNGLVHAIDATLDKTFPGTYSALKSNVDKASSPIEQILNRTENEEARAIRLSDLSRTEAKKRTDAAFGSLLEHIGGTGFNDIKKRYAFNSMVDNYEDVLGHLYKTSPRFKYMMERAARLHGVDPSSFGSSQEAIEEGLKAVNKKILGRVPKTLKGTNIPIEDIPGLKEVMEKYGENLFSQKGLLPPSEMERMAIQAAKDVSALKTYTGVENRADDAIKDIMAIPAGAGVPLELTAKTAAGLGSTTRAIEDYAKSLPSWAKAPVVKPVQAGINLKNATTDQLKQYAQILSNHHNPAVSNIGKSAITALDENPIGKATFLNSAMQSPNIRKILRLSPGKQEKESEE